MTNPAFTTPNQTDFGYEFNYSLWTANTQITLTNVPWNNDYRDIVKFETQNELDAYIDAKASTNTRITDSVYAKVMQPVRLQIPFNKAYQYNYLRAMNPEQPINGGDTARSFYYFITGVNYIAPDTTEIIVQLDVWQTFGFDATFGNCYIERGHIGIANEKQFDNYGRDYLTIPEGLDTGGEYTVVDSVSKMYMAHIGTDHYDVLVASTVDLLVDGGTPSAPVMRAAKGGTLSNLRTGATFYVFDGSTGSLATFLASITDKPWVSQGIVSITLIPRITRYIPSFDFAADGTPTLAPATVPPVINYKMFVGWRNAMALKLPERYRHLMKFLTFPYLAVEMTAWVGQPIIIKPESWNDPDGEVSERVNFMPPNQRVVFHPNSYNGGHDPSGNDDGGEYLDFTTSVNNFPTMAIVNNMASAYLASSMNQIAFQNQSADWSQQKALRGNQVSYDQASSGLDLANRLSMNSQSQDTAQTNLNNRAIGNAAIVGSLGGVGSGAANGLVGGPAGAAIGGLGGLTSGIMGNIGAMMQQGVNTEALSIRSAGNINAYNAQMNSGSYIRDTNKSLADYAARGDYENTIAGINAKIQDSKLTQPTTSGQLGGETMNLIHLDGNINLRFKMIDIAHIRSIGDYWLRYGYAVSQFANIPVSLQVMTRFTYWKLAETYIIAANMPEMFKQAFRGMFEKGVTVWRNPDDIGNIDVADNLPLEGISL